MTKNEFQKQETICVLMGRGYEDKSCAGNFNAINNTDGENCDNCKIARRKRKFPDEKYYVED